MGTSPISLPANTEPTFPDADRHLLAIERSFAEHAAAMQALAAMTPVLAQAAELAIHSLRHGGKALLMGNGGSASDAQHLAGELVGRFQRERRALPAVALTCDAAVLTAIANDYGYQTVFARQIEGLARAGDVVVGISTSGNSENVILGLEQAHRQGAYTIGLTGASGGRMEAISDVCLRVPSTNTARVQEMHILLGHVWCDLIEQSLMA